MYFPIECVEEGHKNISPCAVDSSYVTSNSALTKTSLVELNAIAEPATMTAVDNDSKIEDLIGFSESLSLELSVEDYNND